MGITKYPGLTPAYLELDPHEDYINFSIMMKNPDVDTGDYDVEGGEVELDNEQVIKLFGQLKLWLLKQCDDYRL